jgi:hypothetical protein
MVRVAILASIVAVAGMAAAATPAAATTVNSSDAQQVTALWKQAEGLSREVDAAGQSSSDGALANAPAMSSAELLEASQTTSCFTRLSRAADGIESFLHVAAVALLIASGMEDQRDDASAVQVARTSLAGAARYLATSRQLVAAISGACGNSPAVTAEARALLDFLDAVGARIEPIARKVGAVSR